MRYFLFVFLSFVALSACRKDEKISDDPAAKLTFSSDTVLFDTVFTQQGSTVASLLIYNKNSNKLVISSIELAGGNNSQFRLNIDGIPGNKANNLEISGNDSLFVFVEVTVDPNNSLSPFLVNDSIVFLTNGNRQDVKLVAYGQNAHYIKADTRIPGYPPFSIIPCGPSNIAHWTNDKPYVIFDYAAVDSGCCLQIDAGTKIYFHKGGGLWITPEGCIQVNGTKDLPVSFQGDRLESFYKESPGQWDRIWINENSSQDNFINFAIIKNGFIGIQTEVLQTLSPKKLLVNNTIIRNMSGLGIYSSAYNIESENLVVANCGENLLGLTLGGNYNFTHCTFANYWNAGQRQNPSLVLNNSNAIQKLPIDATFTNCIFDGSLDEELAFDIDTLGVIAKYKFNHCMLRTQKSTADASHYINAFVNQNPVFADETKNDYRLGSSSYAIDKGVATSVVKDITDYQRTPPPDLGAYEFH